MSLRRCSPDPEDGPVIALVPEELVVQHRLLSPGQGLRMVGLHKEGSHQVDHHKDVPTWLTIGISSSISRMSGK